MVLDYKEIGKRIARRRRQLGLTQAQVSEMVDISDPYMSSKTCIFGKTIHDLTKFFLHILSITN